MRISHPLFLLLLIMYICLASLYLLLIPPWQGVDEPTHFEQVLIYKNNGIFSHSLPRYNSELQQKIIVFMSEFNFWRYVGTPKPVILPKTFADTPFISAVASQRRKPDLYYRVAGFFLGFFSINGFIAQLYILRFFSLFISVLSLVILHDLGRIVFQGNSNKSLLLVIFASLLPQYAINSVTVNTDTLFLVSYFAFLIVLFRQKQTSLSMMYLLQLFSLGIICLLTERAALMVFPVILFYFWKTIFKHISVVVRLLGVFILFSILILTIITWWYPELTGKLIDFVAINYLKLTLGKFIFSDNKFSFLHFVKAYINSFFCAVGWMRYSLSDTINYLIHVALGIGVFGYIISHGRIFPPWNKLSYNRLSSALNTLFFNCLIFVIVSIVIYWFKGFYAQGRFLFPVIWPLGYLVCYGYVDFFTGIKLPARFISISIFLLMFLLNIHTIVSVVLPAFHIK